MDTVTFAWLVLAFPLAGSLLISLSFKVLPRRAAGYIGTAAIGIAFAFAVAALLGLLSHPVEERSLHGALYDYAAVAGIDVELSILVDPLSVFMCLIVTGVSTLIHLYSLAYMTSDRGYNRFFAYLNFFVFSMLLLVLAGNLVLLIVGWAFVGFASYALISFWYRRTTATAAGMKAFVINVVGDIGLVLAAFLILREIGVLDLTEIFEKAPDDLTVNSGAAVAIGLLLLVGAFAKSAQIPLHTWLADAMEGPTPVSALIHAATMVTAGVYLIARFWPIFELAPTAADIAAFTGLATLLFAGTVALVVTDLKRVIAYSTISQIGYMVVGVSIGAYTAGLFHLMTHAFFKALLFMAAGSVIAAMAAVQDLNKMGGFRKALRFTGPMLVIGALALAAFPGTSGFFSKDEILVFAEARGGMYMIFAIGGYIGALMTAVYSFRIVYRVLSGPPCKEATELEQGHLAHGEPVNPKTGETEDTDVGFPGSEHWIAERARPMRVAMSILGFLALFAGLLQVPGVTHVIDSFLEPVFAESTLVEEYHPTVAAEWRGLAIGAVISILGILIARYLWVTNPALPANLARRFRRVHDFCANAWYFDDLIDVLVVRPVQAFGAKIADSFVENKVIGTFSAIATGTVRGAGAAVRISQSGYLRAYAMVLLLGLIGLGIYFLIAGGGA